MNGVLGAIELLQTTPLNIEQQGLADTARNCTLSLLAIINNLLDFSRIESGHFTLHMEETALLPLLDRAMQTIQGQHKAKTVITYFCWSTCPPLFSYRQYPFTANFG